MKHPHSSTKTAMRITKPTTQLSQDVAHEFNLQIAACSLRGYADKASRLSARLKKRGDDKFYKYCDQYSEAFLKLAAMITP
jgi:hypothetical protein